MKQIPNIEEAVDKFIKDNGIVLLAEYTKGDVIGLQSIRTEIENLLHHQLQKAREVQNTVLLAYQMSLEAGNVEDVLTDIKNRIKVYHSELDQDKK